MAGFACLFRRCIRSGRRQVQAYTTFFSYSYDDRNLITDNDNYKNAIKYAPNIEIRRYYEAQALELNTLLKEFFGLVSKEASYDIFISFKRTVTATVEGEERQIDTDDYFKAKEIYEYLSNKYKVFFSPVSIGQDTGIQGEKYEPRILKALQTSQAMILLGSRAEYLEAQWVQNEWRRYLYFINKGKKNKASLIFGYEKYMPRLPVALKDIQLPSFDWFKASYLTDLESKLNFVKTSKGIKSTIKERKISLGFGAEVNFGSYTGRRVTISGADNTGIVLTPTEERELAEANKVLESGNYRLSRDDELSGDSNSIVHQKEILSAYAEKHGFENTDFYVDDGYSGTNFNRPDFQRMMDDVNSGRIGTIIVKDM